ncbi:hypothetical protein, partial [Bradyrhizobium sp. CCBAU 45321]|uniref:hypothetical protein n=1 Tax=Bradyrhizobium sp. CCBAU 45321 TaxID=1641878 RepID=UPI002302FF04
MITGISHVVDSAAAAETQRAGDPTAVRVWDRDSTSGPPTLADNQRAAHESTSEQLSMVYELASTVTLHSGNSLTEEEPLLEDSVSPRPDADAGTEQDALPAGGARWWCWTAALVASNGTLGAFEAFAGRLVQGAVQVLSGRPEQPQQVSDTAMAAHAAVNMAMGLIAGARAGVHTWWATGNWEAYRRGFQGERSAPSAALATAGTPDVPASQLTRLLPSLTAAAVTFGFAAHTGVNAFGHLGSSSHRKVDAYKAVVQSNANTAYCYTREVANFVAYAFQLVSHDALLNLRGAAASCAQNGVNSLIQQAIQGELNGRDPSQGFDLRWPAISAAAEALDVAVTCASARLAEPDRPVTIWRGRRGEGISAEEEPPSRLTVIDAIDRVTQRAVGRQLVGELSQVAPQELHHPKIGPVFATGTHVRELAWQAEGASRGRGASTAPSDLEAFGAAPHAGRSGSPTQDSTELPSLRELNPPPPDVAGP